MAIPVIGIKDLAEVKKTQRLRDYGIIGLLAIRSLDRPNVRPNVEHFDWVTKNIFSISDLDELAAMHPEAIENSANDQMKQFLRFRTVQEDAPAALEESLTLHFQDQIGQLQKADRQYWKAIIAELRVLKSNNLLVSEGSLV